MLNMKLGSGNSLFLGHSLKLEISPILCTWRLGLELDLDLDFRPECGTFAPQFDLTGNQRFTKLNIHILYCKKIKLTLISKLTLTSKL